RFWPHIMTSDVLPLDYVDLVFDCHEIDQLAEIDDASVDVVTLTNVLHHLRDPILFLQKVASKLKPGGRVIATEPYFTIISRTFFIDPFSRLIGFWPIAFLASLPRSLR